MANAAAPVVIFDAVMVPGTVFVALVITFAVVEDDGAVALAGVDVVVVVVVLV